MRASETNTSVHPASSGRSAGVAGRKWPGGGGKIRVDDLARFVNAQPHARASARRLTSCSTRARNRPPSAAGPVTPSSWGTASNASRASAAIGSRLARVMTSLNGAMCTAHARTSGIVPDRREIRVRARRTDFGRCPARRRGSDCSRPRPSSAAAERPEERPRRSRGASHSSDRIA